MDSVWIGYTSVHKLETSGSGRISVVVWQSNRVRQIELIMSLLVILVSGSSMLDTLKARSECSSV